jgi:hypothetical protein
MSSDNYLSLREYKDKKGRFYVLRECTSEGTIIARLDTFRTLRQAMIAAEFYQRENDVEFGLSFIPMTD